MRPLLCENKIIYRRKSLYFFSKPEIFNFLDTQDFLRESKTPSNLEVKERTSVPPVSSSRFTNFSLEVGASKTFSAQDGASMTILTSGRVRAGEGSRSRSSRERLDSLENGNMNDSSSFSIFYEKQLRQITCC